MWYALEKGVSTTAGVCALFDRRFVLTMTCLILVMSLLPRESSALLLDDFSTPQGPLYDTSSGADPVSQYRSAVSGAGIAGGERDAAALSNTFAPIVGAVRFAVAGGVAAASVDPGALGQVRIDYDGAGDPTDLISSLSLDLTDGGASDRFILDISGVTGSVDVLVNVGLTGGQQGAFLQSPSFTTVSAPGSVEILFSGFSVVSGSLPVPSLSSAQQIALFLIMDAGESVSIDAFCTGSAGSSCAPNVPGNTIPEPSVLFLTLIAFAAFQVTRSRQRLHREFPIVEKHC